MKSRDLERVVWREGMLMSPQHLQQQERFFEANLAARLSALMPQVWGLVALRIDPGALNSGHFRVVTLQGIWPDGLPIALDANDPGLPEARSVAEHFPATATMLEVHAVVPETRDGSVNFSSNAGAREPSRYVTGTRQVPDLVEASADLEVSLARPHVSLRFGGEPREGLVSVKIAEVTRDATGGYGLAADYVPPCVQIGCSDYLMSALRDLLAVAIAKQRALSDARRQRDSASVEYAARDVTPFLVLNALSSNIPVLRHVVEAPTTPPLAAYLALCQLAGQLSSFTTGVDPSSLPKLDHNDLRGTFGPLFALLNEMLGAAVRDAVLRVSLEARKDGMWIGRLADERLLQCRQFVLAVEADTPEQDVANNLPRLSKIASWKQISTIVQSATPGVPLTAAHRPPPEVPIRPRQVYFLLNTGDRYWREILTDRNVALYLPPPYDPARAKITLMGIPAAGS